MRHLILCDCQGSTRALGKGGRGLRQVFRLEVGSDLTHLCSGLNAFPTKGNWDAYSGKTDTSHLGLRNSLFSRPSGQCFPAGAASEIVRDAAHVRWGWVGMRAEAAWVEPPAYCRSLSWWRLSPQSPQSLSVGGAEYPTLPSRRGCAVLRAGPLGGRDAVRRTRCPCVPGVVGAGCHARVQSGAVREGDAEVLVGRRAGPGRTRRTCGYAEVVPRRRRRCAGEAMRTKRCQVPWSREISVVSAVSADQ